MIKKYKNIILYSIIALFLINIVDKCNSKKIDKLSDTISILRIRDQKNDSIINKQGKIIKEQEVILTVTKESLKNYTDSIFNLNRKYEKKVKEVNAYYKNKIRVTLDTVLVPYIDTVAQQIPCLDSLYLQYIVVPKDFQKIDTFYTIEGTVKKEGVEITKLELKDSMYGRFITEKGKLFKDDKIKYQIFNNNPYIKIEGTESAYYKPSKKNFLNKIKTGLIYIGIGVIIGSQL